MAATPSKRFVSRAGEKLAAALEAFDLNVRGWTCADFGCNVGGFTDCLLQHGAAKVYAVDTGYGELAWKLRKDPRVVVMERTNVLYCPIPEPVDLVVVDVARTIQTLVIPAAFRWLRPVVAGRAAPAVVSLLKPHYELAKLDGRTPIVALDEIQTADVCRRVCTALADAQYPVKRIIPSPLEGKGGNREFLVLLEAQHPTA